MKLYIAILALVSVGLVNKVNAISILKNIARSETNFPPNSMITITGKKRQRSLEIIGQMTDENPLLLSVNLTTEAQDMLFSETDLDNCAFYPYEWFKYTAVRLFNRYFFTRYLDVCPFPSEPGSADKPFIAPFERQIQTDLASRLALPDGRYILTYVVKSSKNGIVFDPVKFKFNIDDKKSEEPKWFLY